MRNLYLPAVTAAFVTLFVSLFLAPTAFAQGTQAAASPEYKEAVQQVDGITDKVIDTLWITTDYYWHEGDYNRIVALIRVCVEADPTFTEGYSVGTWLIWSMGDTTAADDFITYGLAHAPKAERADMCYEVGWQFFNTKRYAASVPYLQKAVNLGTGNRQAYTTLAHAYTHLKRYDESIAMWQKVVTKYPNFPVAKVNLAKVQALKRSSSGI